MKNFTTGIYVISESTLTSEDKILNKTKTLGEKIVLQVALLSLTLIERGAVRHQVREIQELQCTKV